MMPTRHRAAYDIDLTEPNNLYSNPNSIYYKKKSIDNPNTRHHCHLTSTHLLRGPNDIGLLNRRSLMGVVVLNL